MSEPYFTVIVPAYGVQGFLRACMDSILEQSFGDFEVIAVDDRSPDHCGAILDAYAEADPRVTVLHLEENVGAARQLGCDFILVAPLPIAERPTGLIDGLRGRGISW